MFKTFLVNRLKEPSTYVGLVAILAGAFGMVLSDEHALTIASGVAAIVGALLAAHREAKRPDSPAALRDAAGVQQPAADEVQPEGESAAKQRPIGGARDVHRNRLKNDL